MGWEDEITAALGGKVLVHDFEPRGALRFEIERHGGRAYAAIVFYWPDGKGRELFFGRLEASVQFWNKRCYGRTPGEDERQRLTFGTVEERDERPEEEWWMR